jgi:hypothetical protein
MLVLVHDALYASVRSSIEQYIRDLVYEGLFATAYTVSGGGPVDLRQFLISKRPFAGALLVGSLPVAWFEMADDFNGASQQRGAGGMGRAAGDTAGEWQ